MFVILGTKLLLHGFGQNITIILILSGRLREWLHFFLHLIIEKSEVITS